MRRMNKEEARRILKAQLGRYRERSYKELVELVDQSETQEIVSPSGVAYQLEIQIFWDDMPGGNLRVLASVDDGGWRAFAPLNDDFILAPDGSFVGE